MLLCLLPFLLHLHPISVAAPLSNDLTCPATFGDPRATVKGTSTRNLQVQPLPLAALFLLCSQTVITDCALGLLQALLTDLVRVWVAWRSILGPALDSVTLRWTCCSLSDYSKYNFLQIPRPL